MIDIKKLKDKLKLRIENLSEDKLNHVSRFLESLEKGNNKTKVLSYAGVWTDMDDDTFKELTDNIAERRKNNRTRFF
jgi:hypothetical protein